MNYIEKNIISPSLSINNAGDEQLGELGRWFLSKLFSGRDAYEKMNHSQVVTFLITSLKQSVRSVLLGTSKSIEDNMKNIMSKYHTKESWGDWMKERYTRNYFMPKLTQSNQELREAQTIILESRRNPVVANKDLQDAKWSYVDKSIVKSLLSKTVANITPTNQSAQSSMGSGIIDWVQNNKTMAVGLSAVTVIGFLYMTNQNKNKTQKLN